MARSLYRSHNLSPRRAPAGLRPIVQPVPDFHYNTRLAHVFECKVGAGSLLVCGYDLSSDLARRPAARQLRRSLFHYVAGPEFRPSLSLQAEWLAHEFAGGAVPGL